MTRVDFYILDAADCAGRYDFAYKIIEKAYRMGHKVFIYADSETEAKAIDEQLWQYRESAFLPHAILDQSSRSGHQASRPKVEIHWQDCGDHHDVMINLSTRLPEEFSRFDRVIEIVSQEPAVLSSTRHNYRFYKDRNYPLNQNDMRLQARH